MERLFSTNELSRMWNVSESTVKRWADSGDLQCVKTPGGHRRFALDEISRFQRSQGFEAVGSLVTREEAPGESVPALEAALEKRDYPALAVLFAERALAGDVDGARDLLARAYLRGASPVEFCERIVAPALHEIGHRWRAGSLTVADEHVATRTTLDALTRLQPELLRRPASDRTAVVGCPEDELHEVASRCISMLLELDGWRVVTLGMNTPFFSFRDAIVRHRPDLVCLSATMLHDLERQSREYLELAEAARDAGARIVIGGAGFGDADVRARFPHDLHAGTFRDVLRFAAVL